MSNRVKTPRDIEQQIFQDYQSGIPFAEIVAKAGTNYGTAKRVLARAGITPTLRPRNDYEPTEEDISRVRSIVENGRGQPTIAAITGLSLGTIRRIMRENGIATAKPKHTGRTPTISREQTELIEQRYRNGEPARAIARDTGLSYSIVHSAIRRSGKGFRTGGQQEKTLTPEQIEKALSMLNDAHSVSAVASHFNMSRWTLQRAIGLGKTRERRAFPAIGEQHGRWNGGRHIGDGGYIFVYIQPDDPYAEMANTNGYVPEHRLVMARHLGRPLRRTESVHHIDGVRSHNDISNLQLRQGHHGKGVVYRCIDCGSHNVEAVPLHESHHPQG